MKATSFIYVLLTFLLIRGSDSIFLTTYPPHMFEGINM